MKQLPLVLMFALSVTMAQAQTSYTLFGSQIPANPAEADPNAVALGVKFFVTQPGTINAIRFYRGHSNRNGYIVRLYTDTGSILGQVSLPSDARDFHSGWKTATFASPIPISAGPNYVAAYYTSNGDYGATEYGLSQGAVSGPLMAPASGAGGGNGLYAYGSGFHFPALTYENSNYFVDVQFVTSQGGGGNGSGGTDGGTATCPQGSTYPDGCAGAQAHGSWQIANFFTGYTGTNYGANRPPWNVAGVDYPIGYDTTLTLVAPTQDNLPACASISGNTVSVSGPCTLNGYNFTGVCIDSDDSGGVVNITNNHFVETAACDVTMISLDGSGITNFKFNQIDCDYTDFNQNQAMAVGGTIVEEYNAFVDVTTKIAVNYTVLNSITEQFSFIHRLGNGPDGTPAHGEWNYFGSPGVGTWNINYSVGYEPTTMGMAGTAICYLSGNPDQVIVNASCSNDTFVSKSTNMSRLIDVGYPSGNPKIVNLSLNDNYLDYVGFTGSTPDNGTFLNEGGTVVNQSCIGNKNLNSGATLVGTMAQSGSGTSIGCN